ncbi:MAG: hypothetical protein F4103_13215 [Boseongicola sp. SB0673_bin_14]|nr:hypothetical protein [Boseongicola sp. SB0667_bin_21]MYI69650.1 hypothetical protein [Boseongicola sp. SB0673_bin_14]
MAKNAKIDLDAFAETERDPVTRDEFESAMGQMISHPAKPATRSENREPTREELSRRWKFSRR